MTPIQYETHPELKADLYFAASHEDEEMFHQDDLVQLFPYGLSLNNPSARPYLLLKNATQDLTLPVALNPVEAGVSLAQGSQASLAATPHRFTQLLMNTLGIEPRQCVFVQIKGVHQYVRIYFGGHPATNSIKLRADEAMSLCLATEIPLFATRSFIARSKVLTAEIESLGKNLKSTPQILTRNQTYLQ